MKCRKSAGLELEQRQGQVLAQPSLGYALWAPGDPSIGHEQDFYGDPGRSEMRKGSHRKVRPIAAAAEAYKQVPTVPLVEGKGVGTSWG